MEVWLALLIPLLCVVVTAFRFRHKVVWWEPAVLLVGCVTFIAVAKLTAETVQVSDTEYWGGYVTRAEYYEDWDERVSCRHEIPCRHVKACTHTCTSESGSTYKCHSDDGKEHSNDGYEHPYDVDYHPPYWQMTDSNGEVFSISQGFFEELATRWSWREYVNLRRNYHSDDGDKYVTAWDERPETVEATTVAHRYENRVQVSASTFRFPEVPDPKALGLYDYPAVQGHRQRAVLGADDTAAEQKFQHLNATLGRQKQVRVYVLVYRDKPQDVALKQQWYWQGGNKNEFVIAVGTDGGGNVQWAHPFAWSAVDHQEVRDLLTDTRMRLVDMGRLDLSALADWLYPQVQSRFRRMPFARFSYLTVEPPGWAVVLVFILTLAISVGWAFWAVLNDHASEGGGDDTPPRGRGDTWGGARPPGIQPVARRPTRRARL